jgi:hypothetical protein
MGRPKGKRHSGIDLLIGPLLCGIQVAVSVRLADDVAEAPLEHRIAIVPQPACAHRPIELNNNRAEVLRCRTELMHRDGVEPKTLGFYIRTYR